MADGPQQQKPLDEEEIVRKKAIELRNKALVNKKKELVRIICNTTTTQLNATNFINTKSN